MIIKFTKSVNPVLRKLAYLMHKKSSNLAVAADVISFKELFLLIEQIATSIVILKIHIDVFSDFNFNDVKILRRLANKYEFLIFEDRKFADIGDISCRQIRDSVYRITEWADIVSVNLLPGSGIIDGLRIGCLKYELGLLLIADMSTKNNLCLSQYIDKVINIAIYYEDFVMGFIAQKKLTDSCNFITVTPGINFHPSSGKFYQNYSALKNIIYDNKSDIVIVGRGIYQSPNPSHTAELYRCRSWHYFYKCNT